MALSTNNERKFVWAHRCLSCSPLLLSLLLLTCGALEGNRERVAKAPRALITQRTEQGIDSAVPVAGKIDGYMKLESFIGPTQTKEPILQEINSDDGPEGTSGKPYIRLWYCDAHGAGQGFGDFEGPAIPSANPVAKQDDHISPNEIHLASGHTGYQLVFFNICGSAQNASLWKSALGGSDGQPGYLCWETSWTPGLSYGVGLRFGEGAVEYFKQLYGPDPSDKSAGRYVYDYIKDYYRKTRGDELVGTLEASLKLL